MARPDIESQLGIWSEDPRSVEGAMALNSMIPTSSPERSSGLTKDSLVPDLDPRVVATRAEQAYRQSSFGHAETVVKSTHVSGDMTKGHEYSMK